MSRLRTCVKLDALLELPGSRWDGPAAIVHPFRIQANGVLGNPAEKNDSDVPAESARHAICKVMAWQARLEREPGLIKAKIAREEGVTGAQVTQLFKLLALPEPVQKYLAALRAAASIRFFSVRRLLVLAKMDGARQMEVFAEMQASCERRCC